MIILLDLNFTLVENSDALPQKFPERLAGERYRLCLVEKLRGRRVILITARPVQHARATLLNISRQTGWLPEAVFFNDRRLPPPAFKRCAMLELIMPVHGADGKNYLAIESNPRTRAMYAALGVPAFPVAEVPWETL